MNKSRKESGPMLRLLSADELVNGMCDEDNVAMHLAASIMDLSQDMDRLTGHARCLGDLARAAAVRRLVAGKPAFLKIAGIDGIVRQMPDGTRDLVEFADGRPIVVGRLPAVDLAEFV